MRVVVLHAARPTTRQTTIDHVLSFRRYLPTHDVQYLHFQQPLPRQMQLPDIDLLIVNYDYLNYRFTPLWPYVKRRNLELAQNSKRVVAIAQDDFWANRLLDNWCMDWSVDRIVTPIESGLEILYPRSIRSKEFRHALTGYVMRDQDLDTAPIADRPIHLGQRVRAMSPHLGRLALLKSEQAVAFAHIAEREGLRVDVSTKSEDAIIGRAWFEFLSSCQFTVSAKGGASLNDPYGLTYLKVRSLLNRWPQATFEEVEARCFPGRDMKHQFTAVSPRLFEAARVRTCQILIRDDYLGVLEPWRHYLPLESDMSNASEVLGTMRDVERCQQIADNCRSVLVESGDFDYSKFVDLVTGGLLERGRASDQKWEQFCTHLADSRRLFDDFGAELHDASVAYFTERALDRTGLVVGGKRKHRSSSVGLQALERLLRSKVDPEWIKKEQVLYDEDPLVVRCPWTWRPV